MTDKTINTCNNNPIGGFAKGGIGYVCIFVTRCIATATMPTWPFIGGAFVLGGIVGAINSSQEKSNELDILIQDGIKNNLNNTKPMPFTLKQELIIDNNGRIETKLKYSI